VSQFKGSSTPYKYYGNDTSDMDTRSFHRKYCLYSIENNNKGDTENWGTIRTVTPAYCIETTRLLNYVLMVLLLKQLALLRSGLAYTNPDYNS